MDKSGQSRRDLLVEIDQLRSILAEQKQQNQQNKILYEQQLQQQQILLQAILHYTDVLISIKDVDGVVLLASDNFSVFNGPSPQDMIGKNIYELFPKQIANLVWANSQKAIAAKQPIQFEESFQHKDGSWHSYLTTKFPVYNENGVLFGVGAISTDISEHKALEAQLRQSQKIESLGTLAGGIAHDFNNILGVISGNAEMLRLKIDDIILCQYLTKISDSIDRAANLVKQILTFSRIGGADFKPINLAANVEESLAMARSLLPTNIEIEADIQQQTHNIMADPSQIDQIILNLCTNAFHAMEETGGTLKVSLVQVDGEQTPLLDENGPCLKLTITDTGSGITAHNLEKIFDPFFTTKGMNKGAGLGLSVVLGIVQRHQGNIKVYSKVGQGTTFTIHFPIVELPVEEKPPLLEPQSNFVQPAHIMIVEDEPELADVYQRYLERFGYIVTVCQNGQEALSQFVAHAYRYDLVFTDQSMPLMTGKELSQQLLAIDPAVCVILSTGYSDTFSEEEAAAIGIKHYLMKPIKLSVLLQVVNGCLGK